MLKELKKSDSELYGMINDELSRQRNGIEMIASESFVPMEIMEIQGSILTNKTMEGFVGKRYHAGHRIIDKIETLGIERAKELFGAEYANIQPHSGSQANACVYSALLELGDTVMGMRLDQGGHLTHGSKVNFSGKMYNFISYGLDKETELIDYEELERLANEHKPKLIVAGASSYPRIIDYKRISQIAKNINALFMVDMAHVAGLVAAGVHPSPVPYADVVTSTSTKTLAGARGGFILSKEEFGAKLNKATFPGIQGSMHMHIMGAKAFTFKKAATKEYKETMKQVVKNSRCLAETLKEYGFRIVSGGTDTHIVLVDLRPKKLTGKELEEALASVEITVNKNMIPYDTQKPMITSGVRIGVTAMTIKGVKEKEMKEIAELINIVAENIGNEKVLNEAREKVKKFSSKFPLYEGI